MELRQLRYFLSVADSRSFVSAAGKLFISRQAISKAISQLENELGVELFMRDSNGAFLTPAGILFYERVRVLVMELENLHDNMHDCGSRFRQRIRLALSTGVLGLFEARLLEYRDGNENLDIQYQECPEDACMQFLRDNKADLIVTTEAVKDSLFSSVKLMDSPVGILAAKEHPFSGLTEISVSNLAGCSLAIHSDHFFQNFCQEFSFVPQYQGYDFFRLFRLTGEGQCALLLPKCLAPDLAKGIRWVPVIDVPPWALYKTYPKTLEKNLMLSATLDELNLHIFQESPALMERGDL